MASFPEGVGLIGRAKANGFDSTPNVQELSAENFLRLDLAKEYGVKGAVAVYVSDYDVVVEFYSGEERSDFEQKGILDCFDGKVTAKSGDHLLDSPYYSSLLRKLER